MQVDGVFAGDDVLEGGAALGLAGVLLLRCFAHGGGVWRRLCGVQLSLVAGESFSCVQAMFEFELGVPSMNFYARAK